MSNIDDYFQLQEEIFADFGYEEEWRAYPLDDRREVYWSIETTRETVWWSDEKEHHQQLLEQDYDYDDIPGDDAYSGEIRKNVILVSKDKKYTLILVDTETDMNVFLMIFDNEKRIPAK